MSINLDRSEGYVTDTDYTNRLQPELSPGCLNYVAALNNAKPVSLRQPFTYLELGCGFGQSVINWAREFPEGQFHACDLNPNHIRAAARQAKKLTLKNLFFHQTTFQTMLSNDIPDCDFIVLHGVYSWIGWDAASHSIDHA